MRALPTRTASARGSPTCNECTPGTHAPNSSSGSCAVCPAHTYLPPFFGNGRTYPVPGVALVCEVTPLRSRPHRHQRPRSPHAGYKSAAGWYSEPEALSHTLSTPATLVASVGGVARDILPVREVGFKLDVAALPSSMASMTRSVRPPAPCPSELAPESLDASKSSACVGTQRGVFWKPRATCKGACTLCGGEAWRGVAWRGTWRVL